MTAIKTYEVRHTYPAKRGTQGREALKGIDFSVDKGEIFGFLGPNGSGKTTLFKIISTLITATSGRAEIFGKDIAQYAAEVRRTIGVVFQNPSLDKKLTVMENLTHQGHLYGIRGAALKEKIETLLTKFGISDRRGEFAENLSGGLRRRVEIAKGLIHDPRLLILDEPSTGLDLGARRNMWHTLEELRESGGVTVVLTTHLSNEADKCDRLAVMCEGKIVVVGTPDELKSRIGGDVISITSPAPEELIESLRERFGVEPVMVNETVRLERDLGHEFVPEIVKAFPEMVSAVKLGKPTLEDVFIRETGRSFWTDNEKEKGGE